MFLPCLIGCGISLVELGDLHMSQGRSYLRTISNYKIDKFQYHIRLSAKYIGVMFNSDSCF